MRVRQTLWAALRGSTAEEITATHHPAGAPGRILLMRHAEKTGDTSDILLSAEGAKRAARLVTYIPETFGRPDFILRGRPLETLDPLDRNGEAARRRARHRGAASYRR